MAQPNYEVKRAAKTIYVSGFNPKLTTKNLLYELFTQGGPVSDITMCDTHAFVQFQDPESVPYCLALFHDIELHDCKLRISARQKSKESLCFLKYLLNVRQTMMSEYRKIPPPKLPPKQMPIKQSPPKAAHNKNHTSKSNDITPKGKNNNTKTPNKSNKNNTRNNKNENRSNTKNPVSSGSSSKKKKINKSVKKQIKSPKPASDKNRKDIAKKTKSNKNKTKPKIHIKYI